jgi:hypothetical protein
MDKAIVKGDRSIKQSPEIERNKNELIRQIQEDKEKRDQTSVLFRGENLITYTDVAQAQFVGHRAKPSWKKDYQYNVFDPITRDKVMAIISKSGGMYEAQFYNTNKKLAGFSDTIATVLGAFYEDSRYNLQEVERNKELMLDALTTPKAIWFEGWRYQTRTVRDILERDPESGRVTKLSAKKKVHYNGPWGCTVPVKEIIPGSMKTRVLQDQPRFHWVRKMQLSDFQREFKGYPMAQYVQPYQYVFDDGLSDILVSTDMRDNEVEVIYSFNKWDDKLTMIASGIQLTTNIDNPMPFAHKDYPFAWAGFEPLSNQFVYDMPLTIKILDMQDVNNEVLNLSLDMVHRALNEVILSTEGDAINDDELYGGSIIQVDNVKNFQKFEFGSPSGYNMANSVSDRVRKSIEGSSLDAPSSGQTASRPITAREAVIAREAAVEIASYYLGNMEALEEQKALLRTQNQLDRYKLPTEWQEYVGEDNLKKFQAVYREFSVRDTRLDGGKRGTAHITITETPRDNEDVNKANNEDDKELSQTIDISPEFIRHIKPTVRIIANSSMKKSKAIEAAEARAWFQDAMAVPDVLDVRYAAERYAKVTGQNPDEALVQNDQPTPGMPGMGGPAAPKPGAQQKTPMQSLPMDGMDAVMNEGIG